MVASQFHLALLDDSEQIVVTAADDIHRGLIQRMDVNGDVDLDKFTHKVASATPLDPATATPLIDPAGWSDQHRIPAPVEATDGIITIDPDPGEKLIRNYAPVRSAQGTDYTISVDVGGLGEGNVAGVSVLLQSTWLDEQDGRVDVAVYDDTLSVQVDGWPEREPLALPVIKWRSV